MRERRIVTILFSDLSGFTRLSERMDPEDVADTVDALFHRFRAAIEALGGSVDKFIGDAVMAVFGAPTAHPDDPARAIRAGLALQRELAAFNRERGLALAMRVGVNTGEVLWGSVAGSAPTAMGDTVNVAQRLEGASPLGGVLVSEATRDAAARLFRFDARGDVNLKGREERVGAFEAVEELSGQTEHQEARGAALVGREAELQELERQVTSGRGVFLVLEGSAGIGKSRLLAELRGRVRRSGRGAWVGVGRALETARTAFGPLADLLRSETGVTGSSPGDARRLADALAASLDSLEGSEAEREDTASHLALAIGLPVPGARTLRLEPARAAEEIAVAWTQWLRSRARRGPAILCLEDLHWADAATIALLSALPARLAGEPLAIVATARPGVALPAGFARFPLGDLAPDAAARLAAGHLGPGADPDLVREVVDRAGGHPYFVEELARAIRSGREAKALPDSLLGLLVSRLDELPSGLRESLKTASIFGRAFWPGMTAVLAHGAGPEAFDEAIRLGLVLVQPSSIVPGERQLAFRHALLRDAAYSLLPRRERQRLHVAAAGVLEQRPGGGRRLRAVAAEQMRLAGEDAAAAERLEAAAQEAETDQAIGEAAEYSLAALSLRFSIPNAGVAARALAAFTRYQEVLAICAQATALPELDLLDRVAFEVHAANAEQAQGKWIEALRRLSAFVVEDLPPLQRFRVLMSRLVNLQQLNRWAEVSEQLPVIERMLDQEKDAVPEKAWMELRCSTWNVRGIRAWHEGRAAEASEAYNRAADLARRAGHVLGQAACLHNQAMVLISLGRQSEAAEACTESIRIRLDAGYRQRIGTTLIQRASAYSALGRDEEARNDLQESVRLHRAVGDVASECIALATLAEHDVSTGRPLDGVKVVESILGRYAASAPEARAVMVLRCANILQSCGEPEQGLKLAREGLEIRDRIGAPRTVGIAVRLVARIKEELGMLAEADADFERAATIFDEVGDTVGAMRTFVAMADSRSQRGDHEDADRYIRRALDLSSGLPPSQEIAELQRIAGVVNAARGRLDLALVHLEASLSVAGQLGDSHERVLSLAERSIVLADLGRLAEAAGAAEDANRLADRLARPVLRASAALARAEVAAASGLQEGAFDAFTRAYDLMRSRRPSRHFVRLALTRARRAAELGRPDAEGLLAEGDRMAAQIADTPAATMAFSLRARLDALQGRPAEALRRLEQIDASKAAEQLPFRDRLVILSDAVTVRRSAGDLEGARVLARQGLALSSGSGSVLQAGGFERQLAALG